VGGGPEEHLLRRTAHEAGVSGRVLLTGERPAVPDGSPGPDLPSLTSAMDVFASPSTEEAFGLAAVEALAAGLPVLHGSCPAIEDLPPDASAGARRVRGGPEEYARAIAEVRAAGPAPRTAAEAARHYSITRSSARLMDVYAAAVAGPSPSLHVKEAPSS
jgi:glycosyltransferase involved in cell wall biosynthesis